MSACVRVRVRGAGNSEQDTDLQEKKQQKYCTEEAGHSTHHQNQIELADHKGFIESYETARKKRN